MITLHLKFELTNACSDDFVVASFAYPAQPGCIIGAFDVDSNPDRNCCLLLPTNSVTFNHQIRHVVYRNFGFELFSHDRSDHRRTLNDDYYLACYLSLFLSLSDDDMMFV